MADRLERAGFMRLVFLSGVTLLLLSACASKSSETARPNYGDNPIAPQPYEEEPVNQDFEFYPLYY